MKIFQSFLKLALLLVLFPSLSLAAPQYRGFQIALENITEEVVSELADTWHVNIVRVQIGDNQHMDGVVGNDYITMMEGRMALLDAALPLFAAHNIKVVLALYSPPGGFETRSAPSHYLMFSQVALQSEYIDMWKRIATHYKDNTSIYAFDLLNEPAMRGNRLGAGAKSWNQLLPLTIAAVREIAPDSLLMVKSLYGDPSKLTSLPELNFKNIIYSYHAYPYLAYQHSGITSEPFSIKRPGSDKVKSKLYGLLAKFIFKQKQRFKKHKIPEYPIRLNVGEAAISACAKDGAQFLDGLMSVFENAGPTYKRPRRAAVTYKDFFASVKHESYTIHSFNEAQIWDPRTECSNDGELSDAVGTTDRGIVLQSYFSRNN